MATVLCDKKGGRIYQGDVLRSVHYVEAVAENDGHVEVSIITFPYAIVVSQECDLEWDQQSRPQKFSLVSALLVPLYNYEHVIDGSYLKHLGTVMHTISSNRSKTDNKMLRQNDDPRYHYIEFPDDVELVSSVVDFKQYFTVSVESLFQLKEKNYVCTLETPFKESLVQRFANYLSRIGLPIIGEE